MLIFGHIPTSLNLKHTTFQKLELLLSSGGTTQPNQFGPLGTEIKLFQHTQLITLCGFA
jgi:hypothetical protein